MDLDQLFNQNQVNVDRIKKATDELMDLADAARTLGLTQLGTDLQGLSRDIRMNANQVMNDIGMYVHEQFTASQ